MLDIDADVASLAREIRRLGQLGPEGKTAVKYGVLFRETGDVFEALMGTLRAAKKRGVVTFEGQLLLQGVHDDVDVILLPAQGGEKEKEKEEEEKKEEPAAVEVEVEVPAAAAPVAPVAASP